MEHEASESAEGQLTMEMAIKAEVDTTATSTVHFDSDVDLKHLKQEPGLLPTVESEPAFFVKEEILEESSPDGNEQQCVEGTTTPGDAGSGHEICSTSLGGLLRVKQELDDMDIYHTINKNWSAIKEEKTIVDDCNEAMPGHRVKKEMAEDKLIGSITPRKATMNEQIACSRLQNLQLAVHGHQLVSICRVHLTKMVHCALCEAVYTEKHSLLQHLESVHEFCQANKHQSAAAGNKQQCVQGTTSPAGSGSVIENSSTSLGDLFNFKHESEDIDIGPTALQHMDIYYTINRNMGAGTGQNAIVDDCNNEMPCSGVKKESLVDKLGEDDYDKAHLSLRRQMNLQQHRLLQQRITRSTGFKCDLTIHKPHLHCAHNKINQRNSRKNLMMTSSIAAAPSNQNRDEKTKTKQKACDKGYFFNSSKFVPEASKQMRVRTGEKPYLCDTCDKRFKQHNQLIVHMMDHMGEKPYWCDTCDKKFKQRNQLIVHMMNHTGEKPYRCDTCDKRFKLRCQLTVHMIVHTGEVPYRCDTCDKRFTRRGALTDHMRLHTDEKPYRCDTCDKRFKQRRVLTVHMRVHTGVKPYRCDTCDKRFNTSYQLTLHMLVHTDEKPYRCDTCEKRFKQRRVLTVHMRIHTGEKAYRYDTCDKRFK